MNVPSVPRPRFGDDGSRDFWLDDIHFKVLIGPEVGTRHTDDDGVALLKPWEFVVDELQAIGSLRVRNMLEIGVFEGGSAALWPIVLPDIQRFVGVDRRDLTLAFPPQVTTHPRWHTVRLVGGVSQGDRDVLAGVIAEGFDGPLDLVLDDASHQFPISMATFETCFPKLHQGGLYIIEDWAWAHSVAAQDRDHFWADRPSLANLITRLILLAGSRPDIIERIIVTQRYAAVCRGPSPLPSGFSIEQTIRLRGKVLSDF